MVAVVPALDLDLRGPSVAAEPADKTRRAPHMDVRRFPRGQDAPSENPAGPANPLRSTGREGGVCFLCARFLCTSKDRWLAPSRRETLLTFCLSRSTSAPKLPLPPQRRNRPLAPP